MIISHKKQRLHDAPDAGHIYIPYHMPRLVHDFARNVAANTTGLMTHNIPGPGRIERLSVRIYSGAQLQLRLRPYLIRPRQDLDLINYVAGGKQFIDGDDDAFVYDLNIDVNNDDALAVWYRNMQLTFAYDFRVSVEINYAIGGGGQ